MQTSATTTIRRPIGQVFDYVADPTNEPRWHADLATVEQISDGQGRLGARYRVAYEPGPTAPPPTVIAVVDVQPQQRVRTESEGGALGSTTVDEFEAVGSGTRVTRTVRVEPHSLPMKLMGLVMGPVLRRRTEQSMANLKQVLEAE